TTLDDPLAGPTGDTEAYGINHSGQIVGFSSARGFLYSNNTYTTIDDPSATGPGGTVATGINVAGLIVGYYYTDGSVQDPTQVAHGFLYNPNDHTYTTLDDPFASSANGGGTQAFGINNMGQIVGNYRDSALNYHGFLYTVGTFITLDDP